MVKRNKNQTLVVKFLCICLSFGLWLYISNVENPVRTYEVKGIPVELINQSSISDANLAIVPDQKFTVDLRLEGASSDLYKVNPESFKLVADMGAYALKSGENLVPIQVISYPDNINIKNNGFLGLKINLEQFISKEVALKSKVSLSFNENIYKKDQTISPQKVTISGPESAVNKVNQGVLMGDLKGIDKDIQKKYNIKFLDDSGKEVTGITSNYNEAELSIKVSNEKVVPINIKTTGNLSDGLSIASMESSLKEVHITGDNTVLKDLSSIDTEEINLSNITGDSEVNVKLNLPQGITVQPKEENINVKIKVNKVSKDLSTTKEVSCNVEYINLNKEFTLESKSENVNVTISGTQSDLNAYSSNNIKVVVDLSNISQEGVFKYTPTVTLNGESPNISIASVNEVNVSIKKKV
ncbi:YbbR-like domain-containing protein [Clostridium sp. CTA-5]